MPVLSRFMARLQGWARALKRDVMALWFCARHPALPWWLRLLTLAIVAYALSPIDLIPDFIPLLGYLDDLLLLPLGIWLVLRLTPPQVLAESRKPRAGAGLGGTACGPSDQSRRCRGGRADLAARRRAGRLLAARARPTITSTL